jgi:peptidoglycan/LPS O-acetylase OafA/YrhL
LRLGKSSTFLMARLSRLWPALALSVSLTVIGGLFVTNAGPAAYLSGETLRFIGGNLSLLFGAYNLTGVECGSGLCNVNGSLWTLTWEARCYLLLSALGMAGLASPWIMVRFILPMTLLGAIAWDLEPIREMVRSIAGEGVVYQLNLVDRLWPLFALGIAAYIFRERIKLSWIVLGLLFIVNVAAHKLGIGLHVRALFIGYAVLCFGFLTAENRAISGAWPDYSYGMYIYAFPVMMVLQAVWQTDSYLLLSLVNLLATLPIAIFSWHFVEKPVLDMFRRSRSKLVPSPLMHP